MNLTGTPIQFYPSVDTNGKIQEPFNNNGVSADEPLAAVITRDWGKGPDQHLCNMTVFPDSGEPILLTSVPFKGGHWAATSGPERGYYWDYLPSQQAADALLRDTTDALQQSFAENGGSKAISSAETGYREKESADHHGVSYPKL